MKARCLGFILLLLSIYLKAQTPCFSAVDTIGCVPFTIDLVDCSGAPESNIVYVFEENGKFDSTTATTHNFNSSGLHTVSQLVGTSDGIQVLTKRDYIRVVSPTAPDFKIFACEGQNLQTQITDNNYQKYVVEYPDNTPNDTIKSNESTTHTFSSNGLKEIKVTGIFDNFTCTDSNEKTAQTIIALEKPQITQLSTATLTTDITFYTNQLLEYNLFTSLPSGAFSTSDTLSFIADSTTFNHQNNTGQNELFFVTSFDRCGNSNSSDTLQNIFLKAVSQNNLNEISWTPYENKTHYNFYALLKNENSTNTTETTYKDTLIKCGVEYCYQTVVETNLTNANSGLPIYIFSNEECVDAISNNTPPPIQNLQSTIINDSLSLHWDLLQAPKAAEFYLYDLNSYIQTAPLDTFSVDDSTVILEYFEPDCFQVSYQDICGNYSEKSKSTCPIQLNIEKNTNSTDGLYIATWSNYNKQLNQTYTLTLINNQSEIIYEEFGITGNSTEFSWPNLDDQEIWAFVSTQPDSFLTISNQPHLEETSKIIWPNAFTPNDDDLNDTFQPSGRFISKYTLKIYNSFGTIIFVSTEKTPSWDGTYNDTKVSAGTYYFEAVATDKKGVSKNTNGNVSVIY